MLDPDRLTRRKAGRAQATAIMELIDLPHADHIDAFLDELRRRLLPEAVAVEQHKHDKQLAELAGETLKFGGHAGERLDSIDRGYLEWLRDSSQETADMIGEYLELTEGE